MIEELVMIVPVKRTSIPEDVTTLKPHMFLVNKYLADGRFGKVKARVVANGRDQDPEKSPNKSSPTVAIHSVFVVLGLACQKHWQVVTKIDIKDAFVQTPMTPTDLYEAGPKNHEVCTRNVSSSFGRMRVCILSYSRLRMVVCRQTHFGRH